MYHSTFAHLNHIDPVAVRADVPRKRAPRAGYRKVARLQRRRQELQPAPSGGCV